MTSLQRNLCLAVGLLMCLAVAKLRAESGGRSPTSARVAVVDVQRAFEEMKKKAVIEAEVTSMASQFSDEQERRRKAIAELQADLEILGKDSPAYRHKLAELERLAIELKVLVTHHAARLQREKAMRTEQLYRTLLAGIADVAERDGYDLVLFKEAAADFHDARPEQVTTLIQVRKVLWYRESLDMTLDVVNHLNVQYQARAARPAAPDKRP